MVQQITEEVQVLLRFGLLRHIRLHIEKFIEGLTEPDQFWLLRRHRLGGFEGERVHWLVSKERKIGTHLKVVLERILINHRLLLLLGTDSRL